MEHLIHHGDCLEVLRGMPDNSVDAVVTDPPYGLSFMGKRWDYDVPSVEIWAECLRVLKPGGHLLAFAGTRTQHRMAVRIEDAGFEIRDMIAWVYGSGFPKSLNVAIAIDKLNGSPHRGKALVVAGRGEREDLQGKDANPRPQDLEAYAPATDAARQWQGWGTALKPALEPITVARKPLCGTVAENVLAHGTGAINVDGCRVNSGAEDLTRPADALGQRFANFNSESGKGKCIGTFGSTNGRWPANLIHDGSDEVVGLFPVTTSGKAIVGTGSGDKSAVYGQARSVVASCFADTGSAARFFYCAKASKADRDEGCEGLELVTHQSGMGGAMPVDDDGNSRDRFKTQSRNHHPTVKPTALMRYLCRLVTPPGGTVLDPFTGSGSTGKAAKLEGFSFIGIEREAEYVTIAQARINSAKPHQPDLFS